MSDMILSHNVAILPIRDGGVGSMHTLLFRLLLGCLLGAAAVAPGAYAADSPSTKEGPDLTHVRAAIKVKNYDAALTELKGIVASNPNADAYSLMGYALRKTGDRAQSMTYYRKALETDPTHKGALEYQGELYVEIGQVDKARENLAKLGKLCWFGCEEEKDLKEAIAHAQQAKSS
jgi:tetratricopeptide (TPR) repeat protein